MIYLKVRKWYNQKQVSKYAGFNPQANGGLNIAACDFFCLKSPSETTAKSILSRHSEHDWLALFSKKKS